MTLNLQTIILIERFQDKHGDDFTAILDEILSIDVSPNTTIQDWIDDEKRAIPESNDEKQILALDIIEIFSLKIEQYFKNKDAPDEIDGYDEDGRRIE